MRIGSNPAVANRDLIEGYFDQRVIVPVYIPALDGYFEHMREILRLCLESLFVTTGPSVGVTVISNGCCQEIVEQLRAYHESGQIDQLLLENRNHGKVNSVVSVARGCFENLISVADCDVLFRPGWLPAITDLFRKFPECGFASMSPNPSHAWGHTSATILSAFARRELKYSSVVPCEYLDQFAASVGDPEFFSAADYSSQMVVKRDGAVACVGGGHFAFTIRRELLAFAPTEPMLSFKAAERMYFDQPTDLAGGWKLSVAKPQVWHMGNAPEPWMYDSLEDARKCQLPEKTPLGVPTFRRSWAAKIPIKLRRLLVRMLRKAYAFGRKPNGKLNDQSARVSLSANALPPHTS